MNERVHDTWVRSDALLFQMFLGSIPDQGSIFQGSIYISTQ